MSCEARRPLNRACATDADCVVFRRIGDCCGSLAVSGINRADLERAQTENRQCNPGRHCACAPAPTRLDDGSRIDGNEKVGVACTAGQCNTFLEPTPVPLTSELVRQLQACPA